MSIINVPKHLDAIFDQPGGKWEPPDRVMVIEWLLEDRQFRYLLGFTLRRLGAGATHEDAEDVLAEFFARRLEPVIESYDPREGRRFWNFLLFCLERFCWEEGGKIRRRHDRERPMEIETNQGKIIQLEFRDSGLSPEQALELKERRKIVLRCLSQLASVERDAIVLHEFAGKSLEEISTALGISMANVKVRRHRARQKLAECLRKEGLTL